MIGDVWAVAPESSRSTGRCCSHSALAVRWENGPSVARASGSSRKVGNLAFGVRTEDTEHDAGTSGVPQTGWGGAEGHIACFHSCCTEMLGS
jgi:hypothetical protein